MARATKATEDVTATQHSIADLAGVWSKRPDISARSVLVTILGDTVAPLGGTVWLNDLITMAAPFGFNERLVRTSMFRLVSERWVENERVGRRSRYSLTPFARDEFTKADARIYRRDDPIWNGVWTIVFAVPAGDTDQELVKHLRWRGFAELTRGVYAAPTDDTSGIRQLIEQLDISAPAIATASFDDVAPLADMAPFRDSSGLVDAEAGYRMFVDEYRWTATADLGSLTDHDAFVLRSMVVHDLRRARLRDPELPRDLLPTAWIGDDAIMLASKAYRATADGSWRFVQAITGLTVNRQQPLLTNRFPTKNSR